MQPEMRSSGEADRGRDLADHLTALSLGETVVVALSPQSVGIAFEAVRRLGCQLDLLLVGRIVAPGHSEQLIGSVLDLDTPHFSVDEALAREFHVPPGYLNNERQRQIAELSRLHFMYLGDDEGHDHLHAGKDVVILDDGMEAVILQQVFRHMAEGDTHSVRIVRVQPGEIEPIDDRTVTYLLKEARRLQRLLH